MSKRSDKAAAWVFIVIVVVFATGSTRHLTMLSYPEVGKCYADGAKDGTCNEAHPASTVTLPSNSVLKSGKPSKRSTDGPTIWVVLQGLSAPIACLFALLLWLNSRDQAAIARGQKEILAKQTDVLSRQAILEAKRFAEEHRPHLVLTDVMLGRIDGTIVISFDLTNVGGIDAYVVLIDATFSVQDDTPPRLGNASRVWEEPYISIPPGQSYAFRGKFDYILEDYNNGRDTTKCWLSGRIHYQNTETRRRYLVGFARVARGRIGVFTRSDDPEREYSL